MPDFLPFRGIRYRDADADAVTAPPYDVIDEDQHDALAARDPYNSVRLILPEGPDPYRRAAAAFADWQARGVLEPDPKPRFYGYRMEFRGDSGATRTTVGVLGALALPNGADPEATPVLPHEQTLAKAKSDRLSLLRTTRANFDPIWGLSLTEGLTGLLDHGAVLASCTDADAAQHTLLAVDDPDAVAAISRAVAASPVVLADGHHRFETAITYRDERRAEGTTRPGDELILCLVVELTEDQLCVRPIHRLLAGLPPDVDLRRVLADIFDVVEVGANTPEGVTSLVAAMSRQGSPGLVDARGLALLHPRADALAARLEPFPPVLREVDAARFEAGVAPLLPAATTTSYRNDAPSVAALVDKGVAQAAVLLRPVSVAEIQRAARAGIRMPQKTTFFEPKPRTGLVLRSLDL